MVRFFLILCVSMQITFAQNVFERNCITCHSTLPTSLQRMFMNYLLVYGGEQNMKAGIKHYLRYPSKHISVMSDLFIKNYGIKSKSTLNEKELDEAINIYWDTYKVIGKLK